MPTFKIVTYNANSIRTRMAQILNWLERESPDVLCVQETKVQDADFPLEPLQAAGYHVAFKGQKAHAGVALICRDAPQDVVCGFDDGSQPDAPRLIRAVVAGVPVVNTYVPQGRDVESEHFQYKLVWFERLRSLFARHYDPAAPLVWVGDFNVAPEPIDIHNPKGLENHVDYHPDVRAALERVRDWGFVDVYRRHYPGEPGHFTYWDYRARDPVTRGVGWRIDHIWATAPLAERSTRVWVDKDARCAERPSDHTFVVAEFAL